NKPDTVSGGSCTATGSFAYSTCTSGYYTYYYCSSGWSNYSGSGSSLKCYRAANQ
ncbi:MAG TPA: hypothetical protein GXZ95_04505, partial [Mollicutes bacterium]|nr:hypothetical protein [Mollicutes bacterium]